MVTYSRKISQLAIKIREEPVSADLKISTCLFAADLSPDYVERNLSRSSALLHYLQAMDNGMNSVLRSAVTAQR